MSPRTATVEGDSGASSCDVRNPLRGLRILHFFPGLLQHLPPLLTAVICSAQAGAAVSVLGLGVPAHLERLLGEAGVHVFSLGFSRYPRSAVGKTLLRIRFWLHLRRLTDEGGFNLYWAHGAHAMAYDGALSARSARVSHAHEIHPRGSRLHRHQQRFMRSSVAVVTPEETRAQLLKADVRPGACFFVVPNRPAAALLQPPAGADDGISAYRRAGGSPACSSLVLYQGLIDSERCSLELVDAIGSLGASVGLLLVGAVPSSRYAGLLVARLAGQNRAVHLQHMEYPSHLALAENCRVGAVLYAPSDPNNVFCAPNKVFEYAIAGIPMLLSSSPPLERLNNRYNIGRCTDPLDPKSIAMGLSSLLQDDPREWRERTERMLSELPTSERLYASLLTTLSKHLVANGV
jgi:glycosyltransferase involved in cell wall biosynthesis